MIDAEYWAFICNHHADYGSYGGTWHKKSHELRKFKTREDLDKFVESVHNGEMCDYDFSIELIRTSDDDKEYTIGCGDE